MNTTQTDTIITRNGSVQYSTEKTSLRPLTPVRVTTNRNRRGTVTKRFYYRSQSDDTFTEPRLSYVAVLWSDGRSGCISPQFLEVDTEPLR